MNPTTPTPESIPVPPTPPVSSASAQPSSNIFWIILVGMILIGGAAYFYIWQSRVVVPEVSVVEEGGASAVTSEPGLYSTDYNHVDVALPPISEWKTYTNKVHGYTLKYPPQWSIDTTWATSTNNFQTGEIEFPTLTISNGNVTWYFSIGITAAGDGPICRDGCVSTTTRMTVLGEEVERLLVWSKKTGELVNGEVLNLEGDRAFGKAGVDTSYVSTSTPIYWVMYREVHGWDDPPGTFDFNKNLKILDQISQSLRTTQQ